MASLIEVAQEFGTEEACLGYLEQMRWPKGVRCLRCDHDKVSKFITKEGTRTRTNGKGQKVEVRVPARHLYQCLNPKCIHQFTATTGTIFQDSHLPLTKWFLAIALMVDAKKGVSANQLHRHLKVQYKTAWHLAHRIRKAMEEGIGDMFTGTVEIDEHYVGGKYDRRRKRQRWDKDPVVGIVERGGKVRAYSVPKVNSWVMSGKIKENIRTDAELVVTDDSKVYDFMERAGYRHDIVNHSRKEYVRGNVHTNSIENFWSLFKRGVIGSFHKVSIKHLGRYLNEFSYRFNNRGAENLFAAVVANLVIGAALRYAELTSDASVAVSDPESDVPF